MDTFAFQLLSTLGALALVLALAWLSLRVLRSRLPGTGSGAAHGGLRFLRALPVGPRERLVLVEHRGEQLLLGVTAGSIHMLGRWPDAGDATANETTANETTAGAAPR